MNTENWSFLNKSSYSFDENELTMWATKKTDFFRDPSSDAVYDNAPFAYTEITGDFTLKAKVSLEFVSTYDACVLMAMGDSENWCKLCYEKTDFGTVAVVSVVTKGKSDDANGVNVDKSGIYLQMARKGETVALHYSFDGVTYYMKRIFSFPWEKPLKVGFVAQAPTGEGGDRFFKSISLAPFAPNDIRKGV